MFVKELKEVLDSVPDDFEVIIKSRIDGNVIHWSSHELVEAYVMKCTVEPNVLVQDHTYYDEEGNIEHKTSMAKYGGYFILEND